MKNNNSGDSPNDQAANQAYIETIIAFSKNLESE
jgi:hypothetical protein